MVQPIKTPLTASLLPASPDQSPTKPSSLIMTVVTTSVQGRDPSVLEEMVESLALSNLIFLLADMRMMSQTGRICTKFENLAVDSDRSRRDSACQLAGLPDDDDKDSSRAMVATSSRDEGLSTSQLYAILLLELRRHVKASRELDRGELGESSLEEKGDKFKTFTPDDHAAKRSTEDSMTSLLKAYADLVGRDMNKTVPHIEARRSMLNLSVEQVSPKSSKASAMESIPEEDDEGKNDDDEWLGRFEFGRAATMRLAQIPEFHAPDIPNPAKQSIIRRANDKRKSILISEEEKTDMHFGEVTDALFAMGKSDRNLQCSISGQPKQLSENELVMIMERAVSSRTYNKLDFMADFFRRGTVSELIIKNKAKIVWINDWFPMKECTYAIAVEEKRKRLLVVFRGAITASDWSHAFDFNLKAVANPIEGDWEGKPKEVHIYKGFYQYLFRVRRDTQTKKFDEIANTAHRYGLERIGSDYKLVVCGHSLGAALSTVFSFYASTDERFTRNGPIKVFTFGSPYVGGHTFADCWRHQEEGRKLQYARFYNHNDVFAHIPANISITKRGPPYRHVGIGIKIKPFPFIFRTLRSKFWKPEVFYVGEESCCPSCWRGLRNNFLFNSALPWRMPKMHTLQELQKRIMDGVMLDEEKYTAFEMLRKTPDELYEELAGVKAK